MGGCFSLSDRGTQDPVNGQPQQPGGATRTAKSLCQSIYDFFKKCLYSRWCFGEFDSSMVNTSNTPTVNRNPNNKRSDPLDNTEKRASDSTKMPELELIEAKLRNEADGNVAGIAGNEADGNVADETKTYLAVIAAFLSECRNWSSSKLFNWR